MIPVPSAESTELMQREALATDAMTLTVMDIKEKAGVIDVYIFVRDIKTVSLESKKKKRLNKPKFSVVISTLLLGSKVKGGLAQV